MSLHNEERRLGVPRGSDTLVVPFRYIKRWDLICDFLPTCQAAVVAMSGLVLVLLLRLFSVTNLNSESKRKSYNVYLRACWRFELTCEM